MPPRRIAPEQRIIKKGSRNNGLAILNSAAQRARKIHKKTFLHWMGARMECLDFVLVNNRLGRNKYLFTFLLTCGWARKDRQLTKVCMVCIYVCAFVMRRPPSPCCLFDRTRDYFNWACPRIMSFYYWAYKVWRANVVFERALMACLGRKWNSSLFDG